MLVKRLKGGNVLVKQITQTNLIVSKKNNTHTYTQTKKKEEEEERIKKLLRMRKERFIEKALNVKFTYFVTLTYNPKKYNDITFTKSVKRFMKDYIDKYILVEERHENGNIHFHCLLSNIPFEITKKNNHLKCNNLHWGFYDIKYINPHSEQYEAIILYLSKYMTKSNDYKTNPYTYSKNLKNEYKIKDFNKLINVDTSIINDGIQETYLTDLKNITF